MKKLILLISLMCMTLVGCTSAKTEEVSEYAVKINDTEVSKEEFSIYLHEVQKNFEEVGGEGIWETDFDGKDAVEVAKDNALSTLVLTKLSVEKAEENNTELPKELKSGAEEQAKYVYESLTNEEKDAIGADLDLYKKVFVENALSVIVYDDTVKPYVVNYDGFEDFYEAAKDEIEKQYKANVNPSETVDEEVLKDYAKDYYEEFSKQVYFSEEYEKWKAGADIEKNDAVWTEIQPVK